MRRPVIDHPKDPLRRTVRLLFHDLAYQTAEGLDARLRLAAAHDVAAPDIPGGQVLQGAAAVVLELDPPPAAGGGAPAGMAADAGLDARLLLRADDAVLGREGLSLPEAGVQVKDDASLLGEPRVPGEDPVFVLPRLERGRMQDPPHGAATDGLAQGGVGPRRQVGQRLAAQRPVRLVDDLTSDR